MFSRAENSSDDPQKDSPAGDEEIAEVITGEEVSLDSDFEPEVADFVGTAEGTAARAVIDEEAPLSDDFAVFDDTVRLPTGKAAPKTDEDIAVESETISDSVSETAAVQDVLANRNRPSTAAVGAVQDALETAADTADEAPLVTRRSLLAGTDTTAVETSTTVSATDIGDTATTSVETDTVVAEAPRATFSEPQGITPHGGPALDSTLLAGATVLPSVSSKAPARWLSLILTFIFVPVAWYLLSDASARLTLAEGNPMTSGNVNFAALIELFAGIVFVALIGVMSAYSSLGLLVTGPLVFLLGLPFLVMPAWSNQFMDQYFEGIRNFNDFGANVVAHVVLTGFTGVLVMTGLTMVIFGWVIAVVRRAGRREESMRVMVAQVNPEGLRAHWAKKATERDQRGQ